MEVIYVNIAMVTVVSSDGMCPASHTVSLLRID
jgi:hypothetical protein